MTSITTSLKYFFWFTDTDSLTYEIKSEDAYEDTFKHKHLFDFSTFSKVSKFYDNHNEMVVRKKPANETDVKQTNNEAQNEKNSK